MSPETFSCVRYAPGYGPCGFCGKPGRLLCDYPLGNGKTCDARVCEGCTTRPHGAGMEIDYCPIHKGKIK